MFKYIHKLVGKENISLQINEDIYFNSAKSTIEHYIIIENKNIRVLDFQ